MNLKQSNQKPDECKLQGLQMSLQGFAQTDCKDFQESQEGGRMAFDPRVGIKESILPECDKKKTTFSAPLSLEYGRFGTSNSSGREAKPARSDQEDLQGLNQAVQKLLDGRGNITTKSFSSAKQVFGCTKHELVIATGVMT